MKRRVLAFGVLALLLSSCGFSTNPARWECPWSLIACDMPPADR
ncbi:hypothetical protein [Deinococcus planocerae]|nr:hypothetical protein [Deinococcus planocerae]